MYSLNRAFRVGTLTARPILSSRVRTSCMRRTMTITSRIGHDVNYRRWAALAVVCTAIIATPLIGRPAKAEAIITSAAVGDTAESQQIGNEKTAKNKTMRNYEARLRRFSPIDKVFRYFATISSDGKVYMTTDDFLRSVCAGGPTQPDGLRLDQYRKLSIEHLQREYSPTKSQQASVLFGSHALIEYSEYVLLRALLATPQKAFHIAFQVIDRDDSGTMEMDEFFDVVQSVSGTTGLKPIDTERSLIINHLFQGGAKQQISFDEFEHFVLCVKNEVLKRQFELATNGEDKMSPRQFGATILRQMHNKTLRKKLQVTAKTLNDEGSITFSAFSTFLFFLENIHDVGMALQFAREGNKGVDKESFKRAFRVIVRTDADSAIVDAIYDIFDTNSDGYLSRKEFYVAMKDQAIHVNQNTLGLGVTEGFTGLVLCVKEKVAEMREMEA